MGYPFSIGEQNAVFTFKHSINVFFVTLMCLFSGLSSADIGVIPKEKETFDSYLSRVQLFLENNKRIINADNKQAEIAAVMPYEYLPANNCDGRSVGLLLSHGLSDSPYGLRSLAQELSQGCVHVRVVLLPGHGSAAEDLIEVRRQDWQQTFDRSAMSLKNDVEFLYVGGFSTGGALALQFTQEYSNMVEGVVLFSPLLKINSSIDWLSPILEPVVTWLDHEESDDYAKYGSIPVPAIAQAYKTAKEIRSSLVEKPLINVPVFIALAEEDATVDSSVTRSVFDQFLTHPKGQMVMYSSQSENRHEGRMRVINAYLPEQRITGLSHTSIHGSPHDAHYGLQGDYRICDFISDEHDFTRCKTENSIWFGEKGERLNSKSSYGARITWNPYFDELIKDVVQFIQPNS